MSNKYKHGDIVPTDVLCDRIDELVEFITHGRSNLLNEFCMRVPAELDHDADLVMSEITRRLRAAEVKLKDDRFKDLYIAVNEMMAILGADGEIHAGQAAVDDVMFSLKQIDGGTFDTGKVFSA